MDNISLAIEVCGQFKRGVEPVEIIYTTGNGIDSDENNFKHNWIWDNDRLEYFCSKCTLRDRESSGILSESFNYNYEDTGWYCSG